MAMQTASSSSAHGKSGSSGSISYTLPASPTLTNPDMILPDYDDAPMSLDRSQSPLNMWKNSQFDLAGQQYNMGPVTPTTPIIYGNGTMLSDIGEVTEAESTTGPMRHRTGAHNGYSQPGVAMRNPPAMPGLEGSRKRSEARMLPRERERRLSMESTSTITNGDQEGLFADFDDTVSVDDSVFQGDDEESVAASYVYDGASDGGDRTPPARDLNQGLGPEAEERYSTALSRRAEQILANAKRRLTTMEGNLNRARSSLSVDSGSETSPSFGRPSTAIQRDYDSGITRTTHGHSRIASENNISTAFRPATLSPRSSSALGVTGSYRQLLQSSRSADFIREPANGSISKGNSIYGNAAFAKSKASLHDSKYTLEPLSEDEATKDLETSEANLGDEKLDTFLSPTFGSFDDNGLRRSASTAQMRDLKDHMKELKGRLSSLRDQARADSMKRRSLQSLRTASPFTNAGDIYSDSRDSGPSGQSMKDISRWNDGVESLHESDVLENKDEVSTGAEDSASVISASVYSDEEEPSPPTKLSPADHSPGKATPSATQEVEIEDDGEDDISDMDDMDDMQTEDGFDDDEGTDFDDDVSEGGESLYHEAVQNQVSHEDREDAFDYEHFFLHSAMGSMSQRKFKRRDSQDSYSSEDSVETTRGPITGRPRHSRRGSNASVSTMDSFATATEGRLTRAENIAVEDFPEQLVTLPDRSRSHTPDTAKRTSFTFSNLNRNSDSNSDRGQPRASITRRPQSSAATYMHRPSVSSLGSTGTNRSFPLVNRPKSRGILTPQDSPDQGLKQISETLMSETASICDRESTHAGEKPIEQLQKDDQILVERLVGSLGKCVLGLTESGRASAESRLFRRRIESARRILEGLDQPY
ncbi:uncharacterized protein JN550_012235 [Neoarthrinium moseri]|uniref:uncharacterized protein n=1 Tax=Neoarthrinium moseri TaxID=1658444 RepID=UPI001FDDF446|nr:uncharacterized protein JN550_012235 [Neoarthrinium moseri]KAI1858973.1 hypothetical protein JN550_012235 [Neoarthrinium moseri]